MIVTRILYRIGFIKAARGFSTTVLSTSVEINSAWVGVSYYFSKFNIIFCDKAKIILSNIGQNTGTRFDRSGETYYAH